MGIPILTSEGFVGQRIIVDDYFRAAETIYCGDVVTVAQQTSSPNHSRVFRGQATTTVGTRHGFRTVGIAHTPSAKSVGDKLCDAGDYVQVVVFGIAKTKLYETVGVGDSVAVSSVKGRVKRAYGHAHPGTTLLETVGKCLSHDGRANSVVDIFVNPVAA